jgi:hypothetical protein
MVLFDQIIEIFRGPDLRVLRQRAIGLHLTHSPVRGSITIERDRLRRLTLVFNGFAESDPPPRTGERAC